MAAVTSKAMTDSDLPELVRDSRLPVIIKHDWTIHPQPFTRRNKSREEKWARETNLGRGGYGEVWLEKKIEGDDSLPKLRAVKTIRIPENETIFELNGGRGVRELEALAKFSQDNYKDFFVKSYGWYLAPGSLNIAMEYCRYGDLKGYLERVKTIPTEEVQEIALQILGALVSMHRNGFAHRDLKPANILIKSKPPQEWWVKLCDFGLSKRQEGVDEASTVRGTPSFMPPETLGFPFDGDPKKANPYSADLWCFGETLYRCHVGAATFEDKEQLYEYQRGNRLFPIQKLQQARASGLATNFIHFLMLPNPAERLDTERARRHPWLRGEVEPPSSQVTDVYRRPRRETGPTRITRTSTAQSPSPAVEMQLTDASGQWSITATNHNLLPRPSLSQLSLAGKNPSMNPPVSYGPSPSYDRPLVLPGYPVYHMSPTVSPAVPVDTSQGHHLINHGANWNPSQSIQDLSRRFQRQAVVQDLDNSDTKPKKKSRQKEKKKPKVTQAPTRRATPPPKPRQSLPSLEQLGAIPSGFFSSPRQPQRTPNQDQGYRTTRAVVSGQPTLPVGAIDPGQGFHVRGLPALPAPGPGIYPPAPLTLRRDDGLWTLFPGAQNDMDPFESLRAEVHSYWRVRQPEENGLPPRMRAQTSVPRPAVPAQKQDRPEPYYRPTVAYQSDLRRHESEAKQPELNREPSTEGRPVYNVYQYGPDVIIPARSRQQLRRPQSFHGPPPPRSTTQQPARRSVDKKAYPYETSDSEDERDVLTLKLKGGVTMNLKGDVTVDLGEEVPMTAEHFGG